MKSTTMNETTSGIQPIHELTDDELMGMSGGADPLEYVVAFIHVLFPVATPTGPSPCPVPYPNSA